MTDPFGPSYTLSPFTSALVFKTPVFAASPEWEAEAATEGGRCGLREDSAAFR